MIYKINENNFIQINNDFVYLFVMQMINFNFDVTEIEI